MGAGLVLVTGATGFLGRHLVSHLVASGYTVRALVRESSDTHYLQSLGVELTIGDVNNASSVQRALKGCQYLVHGAGHFRFWGDPDVFEKVNVQGSATVMEAARRVDVIKAVHISTLAVIGDPPAEGIIDENTPCKPADAYQRSKLDAENFVRMYFKATQLPVVVLRPGAFYGAWGRYAFNRLFFEDPLKGLPIQVHWGKHYTFPVFVPDVARAVVGALKSGRPGETYNISGESLRHREVNAIVSRLAGISAFRLNVPEKWMLKLAGEWTRMADRTHKEPYYPLTLASYVFHDWRVSSEKARSELNFVPTPFAEGARQTLEWYWSSGLFRRSIFAPRPRPSELNAVPAK